MTRAQIRLAYMSGVPQRDSTESKATVGSDVRNVFDAALHANNGSAGIYGESEAA